MKKNKARARKLRNNPTDAELKLWYKLRKSNLCGFKFRRQERVGNYIVDFINYRKRIIIELDGGQHVVQRKYDRKRDEYLREQGFEILRFWNNQVFENFEGVLEMIRDKLLEDIENNKD